MTMQNGNNVEIAPIIVDLGKKKRKAIKEFKRGEGKLLLEVQQAVADVRASLGAEATGKEFVPVVVVYQQKSKRNKGLFGF